jgi:hypothetical protein
MADKKKSLESSNINQEQNDSVASGNSGSSEYDTNRYQNIRRHIHTVHQTLYVHISEYLAQDIGQEMPDNS